ncbi:MAG: hypothetical protein ACE5HI_00955 [bacterium]
MVSAGTGHAAVVLALSGFKTTGMAGRGAPRLFHRRTFGGTIRFASGSGPPRKIANGEVATVTVAVSHQYRRSLFTVRWYRELRFVGRTWQ